MPVGIFFCYAHEDEILLNKLKMHLRPLHRQGLIHIWHDRDINAGTEWERQINEHLNAAQIILLLVSPNFMDSEYCYSIEMKRAMERHEQGEALVIPIILRHVDWEAVPFHKLQALPKDSKPVLSRAWRNADEAFSTIAQALRQEISTIPERLLHEENASFKSQYPINKDNDNKDWALIETTILTNEEVKRFQEMFTDSTIYPPWKEIDNPPQDISDYATLSVSDISSSKKGAALRVKEGKEPGLLYEVRKEELSIGRSRESDIFLEDLEVSRLHAKIVSLGDGNYALRDEGSANGTKVNGQLVNKYQTYPLQEGDEIQLGQTVLVFVRR